MRLIQETESGLMVSDGTGWRAPHPGEFVAMDGGQNYWDLNGERAAVAWLKGAFVGSAVTAVMLSVALAVWAGRIG